MGLACCLSRRMQTRVWSMPSADTRHHPILWWMAACTGKQAQHAWHDCCSYPSLLLYRLPAHASLPWQLFHGRAQLCCCPPTIAIRTWFGTKYRCAVCAGRGIALALAKAGRKQRAADRRVMPEATGDIREIVGQPVFLPLFKLFTIYGKIFRLSFGPKSFVIISDAQLAKQVSAGTAFLQAAIWHSVLHGVLDPACMRAIKRCWDCAFDGASTKNVSPCQCVRNKCRGSIWMHLALHLDICHATAQKHALRLLFKQTRQLQSFQACKAKSSSHKLQGPYVVAKSHRMPDS